MNDNLDDWLNSIGVPIDPEVRENVPTAPEESPTAPDPQPQSLTEEDFNDILEDFGFTRPEEANAEEIQEEESEEEEEGGINDEWQQMQTSPRLSDVAFPRMRDAIQERINATEEPRDLDAEEDADWQEAIDSGGVVPVGGPNNQRVSLTEEETSQFNAQEMVVEDNQVYFHTPDGVVSVPIITEEQSQELHELEQTAIEAHQAVVEASNQREPLIPLNSPTLLMDESTTRFSGAEWFNEIQKKSIIIGGCGGIGSNCCFQLARMHPAGLYLYDDDTVETVNMAGQLFSRNDVGKSKVAAISDMISLYTNMQGVYALRQKFTENTEAGDIMLCGFDNMEARKIFFRSWTAHIENKSDEEKKNCLFLDGRLSIDTLQVLCLTGDDYANQVRYAKEFLFSDAQAEHTVCSMKQTTYLACMIGSIMVNLYTNFCANLLDPVIPYDLPFFTEYDAQNMIFKTEK